jgi:hypothetical protein
VIGERIPAAAPRHCGNCYDYDGSEGNATIVTFKPVGPVARAVHQRPDVHLVDHGALRLGEDDECFQKILNVALWQKPQADGVRRIRVCCVRATYAQLQTNVMKDWFSWFPKTKENWNEQRMTAHVVTIEFPGAWGSSRSRCCFGRSTTHKPEEVFKGMALTLLWLNEVDTLSCRCSSSGMPRVGRYPAAKDGGCAWSGIIADFNAPDVDNWVYDFLVNKNLDMPEELEQIAGDLRARCSGSASAASRAGGRRRPKISIICRRAITTGC